VYRCGSSCRSGSMPVHFVYNLLALNMS